MEEFPNPHQPYLANDMVYVIARRGDTFKSLSDELGISKKKLRTYNELPKDYILREVKWYTWRRSAVGLRRNTSFTWYVRAIPCTPFRRNSVYV